MCPSSPAFAILLGPTNPSMISIAKETLFFRRAGISPALRLLVPTFSLLHTPVWVTPSPSSQCRTLSYHTRAKRGNSKSEYRNSKQNSNHKTQISNGSFGILNFVLVICFGFRISCFEFLCFARISAVSVPYLAPIIFGARSLNE